MYARVNNCINTYITNVFSLLHGLWGEFVNFFKQSSKNNAKNKRNPGTGLKGPERK